MFTKLFTVDDATQKQLAKNVQAVSDFAAAHPGKVTFLLAPSASVIYPEELPTGAPMADENAMLDDIFTTVGQNASVLDLRPTFTADKNEYLYFKTDHHWTPNGAYRAYEQFCAMKGLTPFDRDAHHGDGFPRHPLFGHAAVERGERRDHLLPAEKRDDHLPHHRRGRL